MIIRDFKIGDRIEYDGKKATVIGFTDKTSKKYFQIEYDNIPKYRVIGHRGNSELFDDVGQVITVGYGKDNRYNLSNTDRNIKIIDDVVTSNEVYTKTIDKNSSELAKQGITRI